MESIAAEWEYLTCDWIYISYLGLRCLYTLCSIRVGRGPGGGEGMANVPYEIFRQRSVNWQTVEPIDSDHFVMLQVVGQKN